MNALLLHLPALQVVLPMFAAPVGFLFWRRPSVGWLLAQLISLGAFAIAILLFARVSGDAAPVSYAMGGWQPPWGIEYRIDKLSAFVLIIVTAMAAVTLAFARKSIANEIPEQQQPLFYTAFLLCLSGLLGIVVTGDAFNLFVFLEISSLSSYVLVSFGKDRRALTATFQYLVMGTIGATLILIGVGFLYMVTGTLNMADLSQRLPEVMQTHTVRAAFAFVIVGLSIKLAIFPLHVWLPNTYSYAPSAVSIFLAATSTKVALYALVRFVYSVFGVEFSFTEMPLQMILLFLSVLAIFIGSLAAVFQTNVKHIMAYSSIAQIGYMVIGVALANVAGLTAGILHLFNHALTKGGLFMALGCVFFRFGSARIDDFRGLGRTMPWTMAAFVIGGLGLIGVPLTAGFVSKWYLVLAALEFGDAGILIIASVLIGSLLAVAYIWRIVEVAYFQDPPKDRSQMQEAPLSLLVPTWILTLAGVYFGIHTQFNVGGAAQAAEQLLNGVLQ